MNDTTHVKGASVRYKEQINCTTWPRDQT